MCTQGEIKAFTGGGEHDLTVEQALVWVAVGGKPVNSALGNLILDRGEIGGGGKRGRGVGPHPASIRTEIAIEQPLVVLRREHAFDVLAVRERKNRYFWANQQLFNDHSGPADKKIRPQDYRVGGSIAYEARALEVVQN